MRKVISVFKFIETGLFEYAFYLFPVKKGEKIKEGDKVSVVTKTTVKKWNGKGKPFGMALPLPLESSIYQKRRITYGN